MNINELQVGDVIKYQHDGTARQYQAIIVKIYPHTFKVSQKVYFRNEIEYYVNKSCVISKVVETKKVEEIPVTQPMPPIKFTLIPHSCVMNTSPWSVRGYTINTQITGCTLDGGNVDLTFPFRVDIDPNKRYNITIEEL